MPYIDIQYIYIGTVWLFIAHKISWSNEEIEVCASTLTLTLLELNE